MMFCAKIEPCSAAVQTRGDRTDRHDVVVDRLGQADDRQFVGVLMEVCREVGCRGVGVVTADRVDVDRPW